MKNNNEISKTPNNFEDCFTQLEKIVRELESTNLTLNESTELFERGVILAKKCESILCEVNTRVKEISDKFTEANAMDEIV